METFTGLLALVFLASLCAGFVMLGVRNWRANARWAFALSGISFLLSVGVIGGAISAAALVITLSVLGLVAALLMSVLPSSRMLAKSVVRVSLISLFVSIGVFAFALPKSSFEPEVTPPEQPELVEQTRKPSATSKTASPSDPEIAELNETIETPTLTRLLKLPADAETMYVDATRLNVRKGPSKTHKVIWTLKNNEEVEVVSRKGDWALLKGDRYQGWVFATYLTPKPESASSTGTQDLNPVVANPRQRLTDVQIAEILIKRSHAYYSGNCPCPYNRASNGSRCGKRSAYSRPGGASPLCYVSDVTNAMVADYRARQ